MNYLKEKTVYLCGNIKNAKDDGVGWRNEITPQLNGLGIKVLNPCAKINGISEIGEQKIYFRELIEKENWKQLKYDFWKVVRSDLKCCDSSDFIIFNYDASVQTVGSIHELVVAQFEKKVILCRYHKDQLDKFNPWIATFIKEHHFFSEWAKMFEYLGKVNDGILDTSLWVI
jgi:hypothetical protein